MFYFLAWCSLILIYFVINCKTQMCMTRKCHNHIHRTNQSYREEQSKTDNSDTTLSAQQKYSNQRSLLQRDDCKTRKETKYCKTKIKILHLTPTNNGSNNVQWINSEKQRQNHHLRMDTSMNVKCNYKCMYTVPYLKGYSTVV